MSAIITRLHFGIPASIRSFIDTSWSLCAENHLTQFLNKLLTLADHEKVSTFPVSEYVVNQPGL